MNAFRSNSQTMPVFSLPARGPLLGEDYAPPRRLYVTLFPLLLMLAAMITWAVSDETAMVMASVVATIIAVYTLWEWLFRFGPTRFSTLLAMSSLLGYCTGTLNTWLTLPRGRLSLAQIMGSDEGILARAIAAVLICAAFLYFFGELYERPLFGREFRIPMDQRTYLLIYLGTLLVIVGFLTHQLAYMGLTHGEGGKQNVFGVFILWMFTPLVAMSIAVFLATPRGATKVAVGICSAILFVLLMALGRRVLIYTGVEILFALRLTGYRVQGSTFKKVFLVMLLGFCVVVGALSFMLLRIAGWHAGGGRSDQAISLVERIQTAIGWVQDGSALERTTQASASNVEKRTFVIQFFADVLEGSSRATTGMGEDLMGQIGSTIPRAINWNKDSSFGEEDLADRLFGLTWGDAPNSILTAGAIDFGLVGVILYPLMIVTLAKFVANFIFRRVPAFPAAIVGLSFIFQMLQTEGNLSTPLVTIRNAVIFAAVLYFYSRLPTFRLQR